MKLIEEKTAQKFTREEVFTKKELTTIAKRRGITRYARLGKAALTKLVKKDIENAPMEDEIKLVDQRDALKGVFGTVIIKKLKEHDLETFFQASYSTISNIIKDSLAQKKGLKVQLSVGSGVGQNESRDRREHVRISPISDRRRQQLTYPQTLTSRLLSC